MSDFSSPINLAGPLASKFNAVEEGWFDKTKKEAVFSNWKRRLFSFDLASKTISYYADEGKTHHKGTVILSDVRVSSLFYFFDVYHLVLIYFFTFQISRRRRSRDTNDLDPMPTLSK